jgi:ATP-dependent DNA ligase
MVRSGRVTPPGGSPLLGYYEPARLIYPGRVGTGMSVRTPAMLHQRPEPWGTAKMPLSSPPPPRSPFGGPLALSKVHWVRSQLVAEITYLGWTDEPLLRHTVFVGLREEQPAREVRREVASRP